VARATGQRFIHDELRGRVTIILEDGTSPDEALEVLNAACSFSCHPRSRRELGSPPSRPAGAAPGWSTPSQRFGVTTLLRLRRPTEEIARILAPHGQSCCHPPPTA
jgi:hypothetical protein